ncbi:MAG TPA: right-handed parallel beta-helix repeat-containing protein, partial [Planctomycetaceae bacterium]|nr:right-handed parallel beta-helix repeat-containing protein [Planctomycetaceae bacterium]
VEGFLFQSAPGGVVFGANARRCSVRRCRFATLPRKPNSTVSVSGPAASHNLVEDCVFVGKRRKQVAVQLACQQWNHHCIVRRCTISGYYYAVQTGGGSYPTAPPGYHVIEGCDFFENTDGVHSKMTDGIVRHNHLHHNAGHGITIRYGARQLIEGNRIDHNGWGIRLHSPSHVVRNNLIYSNRRGGVLLSVFMGEPYYEPPRSNFLVNNTFWRNGGPAIRIEQGTRCAIMRNIIVGKAPDEWLILREDNPNKSPGEMSGAIRLAGFNLYHVGRVPLLTEHEGGEGDLFVDPLFVSPEKGDFRLKKTSPARDAIPEEYTSLPPIPFGIDADARWRTLGAAADVAATTASYGARGGITE